MADWVTMIEEENQQRGDSGTKRSGDEETEDHASKKQCSDSKTSDMGSTPADTKTFTEAERLEDLAFGHLPPVVKDLYKETDEIKGLTPEEVALFRKENNDVTVTDLNDKEIDGKVLNPIKTFSDAFHNYPDVLALIEEQEFVRPTPIQSQSWPYFLSGHDVVGISQTGTGKTLSYLLPALLHIEAQTTPRSFRCGPTCLIITPTRELAQQIEVQAVKFQYKGMRSACVYGQGDKNAQKDALCDGAEIVVATPGRLLDFVDGMTVNLSGVSYLVLDEADRMLDMGFIPDILRIVAYIRRDRQTCLTSATWPKEVQEIARDLTRSPVVVRVGELDLAAVATVTQKVEVCSSDAKYDRLVEVVIGLGAEDKAIVFANKKSTVNYLADLFVEKGVEAVVMHGGIVQQYREEAIDGMRSGTAKILVATDVASRGLDIEGITKVINLDLPGNMEEYVHRAGRTGRAGKTGEVLTYVTYEDMNSAQKLIDILNRTGQEIPSELTSLAESAFRKKERYQNSRGNWRGNRGRGGQSSWNDKGSRDYKSWDNKGNGRNDGYKSWDNNKGRDSRNYKSWDSNKGSNYRNYKSWDNDGRSNSYQKSSWGNDQNGNDSRGYRNDDRSRNDSNRQKSWNDRSGGSNDYTDNSGGGGGYNSRGGYNQRSYSQNKW